MFPDHLALIHDDEAAALCEQLTQHGIHVDVFAAPTQLLAQESAYRYDFYVVDIGLHGDAGFDLIETLRAHSDAGVLVVSSLTAHDTFARALRAGADMVLAKPVPLEHVTLAIEAVQRRAAVASRANPAWQLDRRARRLLAPDGTHVDLSATDLAVLECFVASAGEVVTRDTLRERLGHPATNGARDTSDGLNATIYRLRRRIERATPALVPLHSKSRVGYVFRATLKAV